MRKVFWIAQREFVATVFTKAFLIGLLFLPVILAVIFVAGRFFDGDDFRPSGQIAIVDPTGMIAVEARRLLALPVTAADLADEAGIELSGAEQMLGSIDVGPDFTLSQLPEDADLDAEKQFLFMPDSPESRLAIVIIEADAIESSTADGSFGSYDIYVARGTDERAIGAVRRLLDDAIVNLRIESAGLDREAVERLTRVERGQSITVTESEERATVGELNFILPGAFMFLLFMGIMGGGQGLMTSTIEEKSSRVVEVLLSAVSPLELMAGKLLGYMAISLLGMSIYVVAGLFALTSFSLFGLLDPMLIVYLFLFFFVAFFVIGSVMLAIGSAVNELREAQSLMLPVTVALMLPWFLWLPISRDPNSALSVAFSLIPPVNTFGMLLRLSSTEPPPTWQVWLSIGIGVVSVFVALWCAARVFRIGLLLTGKPPNFRTLLRWLRTS